MKIYNLLTTFFFLIFWLGCFSIPASYAFATGDININGLEAAEKVNGILIEIPLTKPLPYDLYSEKNQTVNVNIYQGKLDTTDIKTKRVPGWLNWIKTYQFENSAQISFRMRKPFLDITHNLMDDPPRIQISLMYQTASNDSTDSSSIDPSESVNGLLNGPIDLIVIDPGHGGEDSGAVGKNGLLEKDVTLDIANQLKNLLITDSQLKVILTRNNDMLISLEERAEIANRNQADIFMSIHTNASTKRSVVGCETYFLSVAKNDDARAAAALENSSLRFDSVEKTDKKQEDIDFMLMDLIQNEILMESSDLASMIQNCLKRNLSIPSRGVNQAGFVV